MIALCHNRVHDAAAAFNSSPAVLSPCCVCADCHTVPAGPAHPYQKDGIAAGLKNHRAGHVEDTHLHSFAFDEQYNTYHR